MRKKIFVLAVITVVRYWRQHLDTTKPQTDPQSSWCLPGGDFIKVWDDGTGHTSDSHGGQDVFSLLTQVGALDGDQGASFQQTGERLNLRQRAELLEPFSSC